MGCSDSKLSGNASVAPSHTAGRKLSKTFSTGIRKVTLGKGQRLSFVSGNSPVGNTEMTGISFKQKTAPLLAGKPSNPLSRKAQQGKKSINKTTLTLRPIKNDGEGLMVTSFNGSNKLRKSASLNELTRKGLLVNQARKQVKKMIVSEKAGVLLQASFTLKDGIKTPRGKNVKNNVETRRKTRIGLLGEKISNEITKPPTLRSYPKSKEDQIILYDAMKKCILFSNLEEIQIKRCIDSLAPVAVPCGKEIVKEGEEGNNVYVICSGVFEIFKNKKEIPKETSNGRNDVKIENISKPINVENKLSSPTKSESSNLFKSDENLDESKLKRRSSLSFLTSNGESNESNITDAIKFKSNGKIDKSLLKKQRTQSAKLILAENEFNTNELDNENKIVSVKDDFIKAIKFRPDGKIDKNQLKRRNSLLQDESISTSSESEQKLENEFTSAIKFKPDGKIDKNELKKRNSSLKGTALVKRSSKVEEVKVPQNCIAEISRGSIFGELSLMYAHPRTATVKSKVDSVVWSLDRKSYQYICQKIRTKVVAEILNFTAVTPVFLLLPSDQRNLLTSSLEYIELKKGEAYTLDADNFAIVQSGEILCQRIENSLDIKDTKETTDSEFKSVSEKVLKRGAWIGIGSKNNCKCLVTIHEVSSSALKAKLFSRENKESEIPSIKNNEKIKASSSSSSSSSSSNKIEKKSLTDLTGKDSSLYIVSSEGKYNFTANKDSTFLTMNFTRLTSIMQSLYLALLDSPDLLMRDEMISLLKKIQIMATINDDVLIAICEKMKSVTYVNDEYICKKGEEGNILFIIKSGEVRVTNNIEGTNEIKELVTLLEGEYFGERCLLSHGMNKRAANCIAKGPTTCLTLEASDFKAICPKDLIENFGKKRYLSTLNAQNSIVFEDLIHKNIIGMGGLGVVRLVIDKKTNIPYALKCIRKSDVVAKNAMDNIMNERAIMAETDHPFITKLHATFKTKNFVFMLLDVSLGGELFNILVKEEVLNENHAKFYTAIIIVAIGYLHEMKVAYRDLKPENIMINSKGYAQLIDFGFAKKVVHNRTHTVCGTPDYMAPEIITNSGHGQAVDWWALGVLLYELLVGQTPFSDNGRLTGALQIYENILKNKIEIPNKVPSGAQSLIRKLTDIDPVKRSGWATGNWKDVMRHRWFRGFDWEALEKLKMSPPFIPNIKNNKDTSYFDQIKEEKKYNFANDKKWDGNIKDWDFMF